jgi:hypothetical protein
MNLKTENNGNYWGWGAEKKCRKVNRAKGPAGHHPADPCVNNGNLRKSDKEAEKIFQK